MKRMVVLAIAAIFLGSVMQAHAGLDPLGYGASAEGTYKLIYDNDLDITWFDYTNPKDDWDAQNNWVDALSVTFSGTVFDEWRLPETTGDSCVGPDCTNGEMGHLYYTELNNTAGGPLNNTGSFENLEDFGYWSSEYSDDSSEAWNFHLHTGKQYHNSKAYSRNAIAVHSGNLAVVPEPVSMILFGTGGIVMVVRRKLLRKNS